MTSKSTSVGKACRVAFLAREGPEALGGNLAESTCRMTLPSCEFADVEEDMSKM